jgi:exopolyphosphatase / guanosine-5'-triphosphate,3'-diphosphate pyrophosphatase
VANLSINIHRDPLTSAPRTEEGAPGRLTHLDPVSVIDIGSNSVRLVVYEGLTLTAAPVFNEKELCGLGRHVATLGILDDEAVLRALETLARFRILSEQIGARTIHVVATAAVREAANGPEFVARAQDVIGAPIRVLSGGEEATLTAHGVLAGTRSPDGLAADMGGGSLELVELDRGTVGEGMTLPLGGLRLRDLAGRSMKKTERLVNEAFDTASMLPGRADRDFYAIGGTFRALARLHMTQTGYPLHVMHGYEMAVDEALEFCRLVRRVKPDSLDSIEVIASARRSLLPFGAVVLEQLITRIRPARVVVSAIGVREGLLHSLLPDEERRADPLLSACAELSYLRSRSPLHARELCDWTDGFLESSGLEESTEERRLRHAGCLLADIGWRAHPDYRGEQSLNVIAHASFYGIDHPGRAFLALAVYYRHVGLQDEHVSPRIRELTTTRLLDRARILGGALRVAYLISGAMPGIIDKAPLRVEDKQLVLHLPGRLSALAGPRVLRRVKQLGRLIGRKAEIVTSV